MLKAHCCISYSKGEIGILKTGIMTTELFFRSWCMVWDKLIIYQEAVPLPRLYLILLTMHDLKWQLVKTKTWTNHRAFQFWDNYLKQILKDHRFSDLMFLFAVPFVTQSHQQVYNIVSIKALLQTQELQIQMAIHSNKNLFRPHY